MNQKNLDLPPIRPLSPRPGDRDERLIWQKLESRAQVPLHQATLALQNILGPEHPLTVECEQIRFKVNAEIAERRGQ